MEVSSSLFLNMTSPSVRSLGAIRTGAALTALLAAQAMTSPVRGDQVIINGVNHTNAKVTHLDQGKLLVRTEDGRNVSAWIDDVQLIVIDRSGVFEDFNQAEQFLNKGEILKAIARYERTLRLTQEYWADLIACRLLMAHDRAGQIDRTAQFFTRVVNGDYTGLAAAARLYPRNFPEKRDGRVARALDLLDDETRKTPEDRRALIEILRYDILQRTDPTAGRPLARSIMELTVPVAARTTLVYEVQSRAMNEAARELAAPVVLAAVDRAIEDCPEESLPGFLILKGQLLRKTAASREEKIRAAWAFLRVPIHLPDHALAPQALLEAGMTLTEFDQAGARALFAECARHPKVTPELRKQAENPSPQ